MSASPFPIVNDVSAVCSIGTEGVGVAQVAGAVGTGMSALGLFTDPISWVVGQIMEPIYNWILNNISPIKEALNKLLGNPDAISQTGDCVTKKGEALNSSADQMAQATAQLGSWKGEGKTAFEAASVAYQAAMRALAGVFKACGVAVEVVAGVVDMVKQFIIGLAKSLLNDLISKAVVSALASFATFGAAFAAYTAWAAGKVTAVLAKVSGLLQKLCKFGAANSGKFTKLEAMLLKAEKIFEKWKTSNAAKTASNKEAVELAKKARDQERSAAAHAEQGATPSSEASWHREQAERQRADAKDTVQESKDAKKSPFVKIKTPIADANVVTSATGAGTKTAKNADERAREHSEHP